MEHQEPKCPTGGIVPAHTVPAVDLSKVPEPHHAAANAALGEPLTWSDLLRKAGQAVRDGSEARWPGLLDRWAEASAQAAEEREQAYREPVREIAAELRCTQKVARLIIERDEEIEELQAQVSRLSGEIDKLKKGR
ncbi:hypothetical protein AAII07_31920 [Microvirga sp. 0TCS3.31]